MYLFYAEQVTGACKYTCDGTRSWGTMMPQLCSALNGSLLLEQSFLGRALSNERVDGPC